VTIGVEQQGEQRRVEALERREEGARLGAVADAAECERDAQVAARQGAQAAGAAVEGKQRPEQRRRQQEAH
jgi:hypothetical protein